MTGALGKSELRPGISVLEPLNNSGDGARKWQERNKKTTEVGTCLGARINGDAAWGIRQIR